MKIRTDFVTNSSSSSFILGFKNKDSIKDIIDELPDSEEFEKENIISDIENGIITKEEAAKYFIEHQWTTDWKFNGKKYWDLTKEERHSKEYEKFIEDKKEQIKNELIDKMNGKVISMVEYGDHESPELEHEIMPYLSCTIERISHH